MKSALERFAKGELLIVVDDLDRENEGDLILLAEKATTESVAFMVRHTTGILCVALSEDRARALELPLMVENNQDLKKTAFTISVDAKAGLTTGVSATERANTVRELAKSPLNPGNFVRPGHIFPLIADPAGLTSRAGHTEAGVALAQLVGATQAALLSEIVNEDGSMARGDELKDFSATHNIPMISIAELKSYIQESKAQLSPERIKPTLFWAELPTRHGAWQIATFDGASRSEHAIAKFGHPMTEPLVRIHSECFTGDVLHSQRCDCGEQLEVSMQEIVKYGNGYIIYLRNHEGRGIGLREKIKAYRLQDQGHDTVQANIELGHPADARDWRDAVSILNALEIQSIILLTNNPEKVAIVKAAGIGCTQRSIEVQPNEFNARYLKTKAEKLGHVSVRYIEREE